MSSADAATRRPGSRAPRAQSQHGLHPMRKWAWAYAILFFLVVAIGYVPGLTYPDGSLLGLFSIQLVDDALHLGSGIWAALAAWRSVYASTLYFKLFGMIYFLDGVVGLIFGTAFLDGAIIISGPASLDFMTRLMTNLPHLVIGGTAVIVGFVAARRYAAR